MTTWIPQLIVALISLVTGIVAYLTAHGRKEAALGQQSNVQSGEPNEQSDPAAPVRPPLNGYASILRDTLDRLEWLRQENEHVLRQNDELRAQNDELRGRLEECERRHRQARSTPRTARTRRSAEAEPKPPPRTRKRPPRTTKPT